MKNKKAGQNEAKEKHFALINATKKRRHEEPILERGKPTKKKEADYTDCL